MPAEHESHAQAEPKKVCRLSVRDIEGSLVLDIGSVQSMAIVQKVRGKTGEIFLNMPAVTFVIDVKDAEGKIVMRTIEAASLAARMDAARVLLRPITAGNLKKSVSDTDPEMPVAGAITVSDKPLIASAEPTVKKRPMEPAELAVRAALASAVYEGQSWAVSAVEVLLKAMKLWDATGTAAQQLSKLNAQTDISLRKFLATVLGNRRPEQARIRVSIRDFCRALVEAKGPASAWAEQQLVTGEEKEEEVGEEHIGVVSGKYPSATRALELLKGTKRHVSEGLEMLESLTGFKRYVDIAAASPKERESLQKAKELIIAAQKKDLSDKTLTAYIPQVRMMMADRGITKTENTVRQLGKIQKEAEDKAQKQ